MWAEVLEGLSDDDSQKPEPIPDVEGELEPQPFNAWVILSLVKRLFVCEKPQDFKRC
jgi:hypothetical protein